MAPWDRDRFAELENKIVQTMSGKRPVLDVPYYIFLYNPGEEFLALKEFQNLEKRLKANGYSVETIWMSELLINSLRNFGFLEDKSIEEEAVRRDIVKRDLDRVLPERIAIQMRERLKNKDINHCVIILRSGCLHPFVHVSTLLAMFEKFVRCTLAIAYPGDKEGRMLNEKGDDIRKYYRAEVI